MVVTGIMGLAKKEEVKERKGKKSIKEKR